MSAFFKAIWEGIKTFGAALLPFQKSSLPTIVRFVAWAILILAVEIGLYFLGERLHFHTVVAPPSWLHGVETYWLPVLGLLFILICVVLYWLYVLLTSGEGTSAFPDIDQAWQEARQVLGQAGLRLPDMPLFLVLGRPETSPAQPV